jgi:prolyl-tRNA editing enzyme YbaK/EbsC (Cys-tRNA(Pro) deacylase)
MELKKSAKRVQEILESFDYELVVKQYADSTRTAQQAADAIGCTVAMIAKSLIFKGKDSGKPILVIASGVNRVNEKAVGRIIGEKLLRADADFVFENTGYKIGGVPPVGHIVAPITLIDEDILALDEIWAAAGTPNAVFRLTGDMLLKITDGKVISIK